MFNKKRKEILEDYEEYEDEIMTEEEYLAQNMEDNYKEEITIEEDAEYYSAETDEYIEKQPKNRRKLYKRIINIVFVILMLSMIMISVDVISVARYDKGPFFAVKTKTYKDGGTKEYYGLGYKVIKYNQIQGRRDIEIGLWNLPYNTEPTNLKDLDLAIEFTNNPKETYEKYYKEFVRIESTLYEIDKENNKLKIGYQDEGKKYTLDIICKMADKETNISELKEKEKITIIGTITKFTQKDSKNPNNLYINNCFAEH